MAERCAADHAVATRRPRAVALARLDREIARERRAFPGHLAAYVFVIALLWAINLTTSPDHVWALWPMFGWGTGLIGHSLGMQREVARLEDARDAALAGTPSPAVVAAPAMGIVAPPSPQIALPSEADASDDTLVRAEALLRRERTS